MRRALLRRGATWLGRAVAGAAVVFVAVAVKREWGELSSRSLGTGVWMTVVVLGFIYGAALMIVAESWHRLISDFVRTELPRRLTLSSYAVSQPAKYLPGNVFQYFARHAWLVRAGVANKPLLKAMSCDVILMLLAATLVGIAAFLIFPMPIAFLSKELLQRVAVAVALLATIGAVALALIPRLQQLVGALRPRATTVVVVVPLLIVFFFIQGLVFSVLGHTITDRLVPQLVTVAAMSWMAGFVPLGTPGGLGTREAMVMLLAGPLIGEPEALMLAGTFRIVTVLGDITCAGIGWAITRGALPISEGVSLE